jgi:hypothetical protein
LAVEKTKCDTGYNHMPYVFYDRLPPGPYKRTGFYKWVIGLILGEEAAEVINLAENLSNSDPNAILANSANAAVADAVGNTGVGATALGATVGDATVGAPDATVGDATAAPDATVGDTEVKVTGGTNDVVSTSSEASKETQIKDTTTANGVNGVSPSSEASKETQSKDTTTSGGVSQSNGVNGVSPYDEDETPELQPMKTTITKNEIEKEMWTIKLWYIYVKNLIIKSIAKTYYTERLMMHKLFSYFTPMNEDESTTFKMVFGPLITMFLGAFMYIIGFVNFIIQLFMEDFILAFFASILLCWIIFPVGILIGIEQLLEFIVKMTISPSFSVYEEYDKEKKQMVKKYNVMKILSLLPIHQGVIRFVFAYLTLNSAFTYLTSEISIPMTVFYILFELVSYWRS